MSDAQSEMMGEAVSTINSGYQNTDALRMRLDNDPLLERLENYIRGTAVEVLVDEKGRPFYKIKKVCNPKANTTGVYNIMSWLRGVMNTALVQGNIENFDQLRNDCANHRMDFAQTLMVNRHNWGVSKYDIEGIIDLTIIQLKYFLSRLVSNKERESYTATIRHSESSSSVEKERGRTRLRVPGWGGS